MNRFAIDTTKLLTETPYSHGFSRQEEEYIKEEKIKLEKRDLLNYPVTLEEFKTIIVPWNRIHRVEQFILNPPKVKKVRTPRTVKPRIVKPKKLTKKAIETKLSNLIFKQATGETLSEEDTLFLETYTKTTYQL